MPYDRYKTKRRDGVVGIMPTVTLSVKATDEYTTYYRNESKRSSLNNISYDYYNDPSYDWLILLANPEFGGLEFDIPDGTKLRIPYPLETTLEEYNDNLEIHYKLYGE